jgi:hypothetical protein
MNADADGTDAKDVLADARERRVLLPVGGQRDRRPRRGLGVTGFSDNRRDRADGACLRGACDATKEPSKRLEAPQGREQAAERAARRACQRSAVKCNR